MIDLIKMFCNGEKVIILDFKKLSLRKNKCSIFKIINTTHFNIKFSVKVHSKP